MKKQLLAPSRCRKLQCIRLIRLFVRLAKEPWKVTTQNICREDKVSRRTFLRDLQRLREAGIAVTYDQKMRHFRVDWPGSTVCEGGFDQLAFELDESIALLAILDRADCPLASELHHLRIQIYSKLVNWLTRAWGDCLEQVMGHSKVLAFHPSESISRVVKPSSEAC
jgi:hypothetical protein